MPIMETRREQADEILLDTMKKIQGTINDQTPLPLMEEAARALAMLAEAISEE